MSRFLVDTQLLVWSAEGSKRLPARVACLFRQGRHEFFYSAASLWEVAIKAARDRRDFVVDARHLREALDDNGFQALAVNAEHALAVASLPMVHGDPFDRMLVAQSLFESMALITSDARLAAYPGTIEVV